MKKDVWVTAVGVIAGVAIGFAVLQIFRSSDSSCSSRSNTATSHKVVFHDGDVTPEYTTANRCDTLIITNMDSKAREIAFGVKDKHINYAGNGEKVLNEGKSMTITLTETGTYHFHDHLDETVGGEIIIK